MTEPTHRKQILALTTEIVTAQLSRSRAEPHELPQIIRDVYQTLLGLSGAPVAEQRPDPAVPVKKSVTAEYIICLEDGRRLKMLKRHLKSAYNMTPDQYRDRWGLPPDYPMVAPNYAVRRRELAKEIGLGVGKRRTRKG